MDEAAQADRIIVMREGRIIIDDTPKKVFCEGNILRTTGLDIPQSAQLAHLLKKDGLPIHDGIIFPDECIEEIKKLL